MKDTLVKITDARQFGRVAVVMGGQSAEREVSLDSGRNVSATITRRPSSNSSGAGRVVSQPSSTLPARPSANRCPFATSRMNFVQLQCTLY